MRRSLTLFFSLLLAVFCLFSCKDKNSRKVDPGFGKYIAAYTSGVVSSQSKIVVRLVSDYEKKVKAGDAVPEGIFQLSPKVEGKAYWSDARTIEFRTEDGFQSGKKYDVKLHLSKLMQVDEKYKTLRFNFQTIKQSFSFKGEGLQTYDKSDMKNQKYKGYLITADVIKEDEIEKVLQARFNGEEKRIEWVHSLDGKLHNFVIDSLQRTEQTGRLLLTWDGSEIGLKEKGEKEEEVPALDVFKVLNARVIQQPQQYVSIRFSDPLKKNQNLKGLVQVDNESNLRFIIDGNELRVYPAHRLSGRKQVAFAEGIRNAMNYTLVPTSNIELIFQDIKPAVRLLGKGVISPSSQGLIVPFEAVSLKSVDLRIIEVFQNNILQYFQENRNVSRYSELKRVGRLILDRKIDLGKEKAIDLRKWNAYTIDISDYIEVHPGAIYRFELRFNREDALYVCADDEKDENLNNSDELKRKQAFDEEQKEWDRPGWYSSSYYPAGYSWSEQDNPCHVSYYNHNRFVSRNIFASDLGLIAKAGNSGKLTVAVSNLLSAEPEADVQLDVYNYQNQLIGSSKSDSKGLAKISVKSKGFLLIAKKGDQRAYLRLDDGSSLSLSNFDIRGEVVQKGIKGYIYGERGVWRPGDKIYTTFVMEDSNHLLPENHPVVFELINPDGKVVVHQVSTSGVNGFYVFTSQTEAEAPTGRWLAKVKVGGAVFTKSIKIETVKPNRLKINLDFGKKVLKSNEKTQAASLEVKWLHGAPARNLKANISLRLTPRRTKFKGYEEYLFEDGTKEFYADENVIFDGKVNENGKATFTVDIDGNESAPGMLNANFITRVFEAGGDYSIDMQKIPFASYTNYVGMKMPESDRGWYTTDHNYQIDLLALNADGKLAGKRNLQVKVYKIAWRWWWDSDEENLASFINRSSTRIVQNKKISTVNGKAKFNLNIKYRNWDDCGRYLIQVIDKKSGHSVSTTAYFSEYYGRVPNGVNSATMLSFVSDKDKYSVGEKAKITIPSSQQGRALVSIETGAKVLDVFWVETQAKNTEFTFDIKPEMAPNCYVSVSLLQPHAQTVNDRPIRMYGVTPIFVEDPNTRLHPQIKMADVIEPEKEFEVHVSEKNDNAMTYTIAVVDDGLLDLTRFQTPNPWPTFYAREALGVKTWDMYDQVMGAFGAQLESAFAIGGDESLKDKKPAKANRFKPVVMFYGPFDLHAGDQKTHRIKMPNYVGSVRTMVVAGYRGAYGRAEKTTTVRKPLMVLATLPRVVGPGESVKLPVSIFAMDPKVKNVKVKVKANGLLLAQGETSKQITFEKTGEQMVDFDFKVASKLGIAKVSVEASSGNAKAHYDIELDVRNPNPRVVNVVDKVLDKNSSWEQVVKLPGMEGTNKAVLELSSIPPIDFGRRLEYLIRYPHGCIEQTTSSVFPQLFLDQVVDLTSEQKLQISENIKEGLNRLLSFQLGNGGFSYWPGGYYANDWGTSYAGHFMLKAQELGYTLPVGLKSSWLKFQRSRAKSWGSNNSGYYYSRSDLLQAYRLYTLALAETPDLAAMNRLREKSNLKAMAKWRLAAAYRLIGQTDVAKKIVEGLGTHVPAYRENSGCFGSDTRDKAMILESLSLLGKKEEAFPLVKELSDRLSSSDWMSTQTTAYCLVAMSEFAGRGESKNMNFSYSINGGERKELTSTLSVSQIQLDTQKADVKVAVSNLAEGVLYARIVTSGIPETGDQTAVESNLKMRITYQDMNGNSIDVSKLQQGTDFKAIVHIQNPNAANNYEQMALTQIFPSGWEIVNTRFGEIDEKTDGDKPTYQDIRDDRVYTYFDVERNKSKTFIIQLNAAYVGRFYLPTINCEAMYDDQINARKPGKWVEVVRE